MTETIEILVKKIYCGPCATVCPNGLCPDYIRALLAAREAGAAVLEIARDEPIWRLAGYLRDTVGDLRGRP